MGKSNGKAKRKAEKLETVEVGMLPVNYRTLTPERATKWLREEHIGFHDLVSAGLEMSTDKQDRSAFSWLNYSLRCMVEACNTVVTSGEPVKLKSELDIVKNRKPRFEEINGATRILRLPGIAGAEDFLEEAFSDGAIRAFDAIAHTVQRYVDAAAKAEHEKERGETRAYFDANDLSKRLEAIDALFMETRSKRDDLAERLVAVADAELDRQFDFISYERELILHEMLGDDKASHPGKPPKGYKPITGIEAWKARPANA